MIRLCTFIAVFLMVFATSGLVNLSKLEIGDNQQQTAAASVKNEMAINKSYDQSFADVDHISFCKVPCIVGSQINYMVLAVSHERLIPSDFERLTSIKIPPLKRPPRITL